MWSAPNKPLIPTSFHFHKLFKLPVSVQRPLSSLKEDSEAVEVKSLILICCSDFLDYRTFLFPSGTGDQPEAHFSVLFKRYFYLSNFSTEKEDAE